MSDSAQRRRIVRKEPKQDPTTSYTMPKRVHECYRCETKPKYTVSTLKYKGATPTHKYYCPECGQGMKYDLQSDDGQAHAALIWNNAQATGKENRDELQILTDATYRLMTRKENERADKEIEGLIKPSCN